MRYWRLFEKKRPIPGMYICAIIPNPNNTYTVWLGNYNPETIDFIPLYWIRVPDLRIDETQT